MGPCSLMISNRVLVIVCLCSGGVLTATGPIFGFGFFARHLIAVPNIAFLSPKLYSAKANTKYLWINRQIFQWLHHYTTLFPWTCDHSIARFRNYTMLRNQDFERYNAKLAVVVVHWEKRKKDSAINLGWTEHCANMLWVETSIMGRLCMGLQNCGFCYYAEP